MKNFVIAMFAIVAMAGCKKEAQATEEPATATDTIAVNPAEKNTGTAKEMVKDLNDHEITKLSGYIAGTYTEYGDGTDKPHTFNTIDSLVNHYQDFLKMVPDMKSSDQEYFASEDGKKVAVISTFTGTWTGDSPEFGKATGKSFKFTDCDIYGFNDEGKIISHRYIYPDKSFFEQIGVTDKK